MMMITKIEATWKKLIMVNYVIDPECLLSYLPFGTELDFYGNDCYVSLVGFMFSDSRLGGIKIPFHQSFEEVNLRFYVLCKEGDTSKRGVVFIKELVPKPAVTTVANLLYKEHYETCPMQHTWEFLPGEQRIQYRWKKRKWHSLKIVSDCIRKNLIKGSAEDFFTEHYWGYTKIHDQRTLEYSVDHPEWHVYDTIDYTIDVDFGSVYGKHFEFLNSVRPTSVFLAEGSGICLQKQGDRG